ASHGLVGIGAEMFRRSAQNEAPPRPFELEQNILCPAAEQPWPFDWTLLKALPVHPVCESIKRNQDFPILIAARNHCRGWCGHGACLHSPARGQHAVTELLVMPVDAGAVIGKDCAWNWPNFAKPTAKTASYSSRARSTTQRWRKLGPLMNGAWPIPVLWRRSSPRRRMRRSTTIYTTRVVWLLIEPCSKRLRCQGLSQRSGARQMCGSCMSK